MRHSTPVRLVFVWCLVLGLALAGVPKAHAVPLLRVFGGPAGFGTGVLPGNDDGSTTTPIDLTGAFSGGLRFFGGPYTQFWVNNNGNITFSGPVYNYTPMPFPIAARPMIAPYWGDVDTRNRTDLVDPTENLVYWHLEPGRLVVTWYNVGYFASHNDLRMSFQLIITNAVDCGSGDFDVEFRYDRCEWTTGDASGGTGGFGGTPAQAGFDAGNLMDYVALPGSFTADIVDLCTTSNVERPGIWQFSVRSGGVVCPEDMPCEVPDRLGPCALGRTQCVGTGIECQPITTPAPESCDGVDNDCDGEPDDGMGLCGGGETCVRGTCVPTCFEGGCADGFTCEAETGVCIETACIGVTCEVGQRCRGGSCVDACDGIVCPHGDRCIFGACVDPCAAVTCAAGESCRDGLCVKNCPCSPCPAGETCNADGTCSPRGCDIVLCDPGAYCEEGTCHDACEGVVCPPGQYCSIDTCVVGTPPRPDAGVPDVDAQVGTDAGPVGTDAGMGEMDAGREPPPPGSRGCDCRVAPHRSIPSAWALGVLAMIGLAVARRRRR